ncbi:MAG: hypothetical protein GX801_10055 [Fibrobacter sp.]|nr:hypothetical protein [Fibrobacter sp.]
MRQTFFSSVSVLVVVFLFSCSSSKNVVLDVPTDLPEICKGIDFVSQPDMRELCGVRTLRYQAYQNIALQRYLIMPKGASIVKSQNSLELRLPNILPIPLPQELANSIEFSQEKRLEQIKNTMDYKELFTSNRERIKIFKLSIPLDAGGVNEFCFNIPEVKLDNRKRTHSSTRIESLKCSDYDNIIAKYSN